MLLALEFFRIRKFTAARENAVLRLEPGCVRPGRFGGSGGSAGSRGAADALCRLGDLDASDEAFQVAFLFGIEIAVLVGGRGLELGLVHSAGTCVGAVSGTGAATRGLWVM